MKLTEIKSIPLANLETYINFKSYLPLLEKKVLIENVLARIIDIDENAIATVDYTYLDFFFTLEVLKAYLNIEFSEDMSNTEIIEVYDYIIEQGIFERVKSCIGKDYEYLTELLHKEIQQKLAVNNSIANVLAVALNKLINKIPDAKQIKKTLDSLPKVINKIDKERLSVIVNGFKDGVRDDKSV